ncbi:hypothetical protein SORBI_3003G395450 [Sorghum bicolor]|uniref:Uncharacterized protein n=1 Tax=Sorghum bicolor TaxID=4558 RepID=A0A1W0W142_SORBI|nr:hypothetical protein SORBI_3003G395450 [Sorghum bicolor]
MNALIFFLHHPITEPGLFAILTDWTRLGCLIIICQCHVPDRRRPRRPPNPSGKPEPHKHPAPICQTPASARNRRKKISWLSRRRKGRRRGKKRIS